MGVVRRMGISLLLVGAMAAAPAVLAGPAGATRARAPALTEREAHAWARKDARRFLRYVSSVGEQYVIERCPRRGRYRIDCRVHLQWLQYDGDGYSTIDCDYRLVVRAVGRRHGRIVTRRGFPAC